MNLCQTCQHWAPYPANEWGALRGAGICQKVPHIPDVTERKEDADGWHEYLQLKPQHAGVLATVEDGSGYQATLITMPTFGCIQHEEKTS